jgi:3-oxoacyl-[acyl-carrier protein] reductase
MTVSSNPLLQGRVALVTGASRGIGAATAALLARHGAKVGVNYFNSPGAADAVVRSIQAGGGEALALKADVRDPAQVADMVQRLEGALGPIDSLVINANAHFKMAPFLQQTWADFEGKWSAELKGAFYPCQAVLPGMLERGAGSIVAVSSGLSRQPGEGFSAHTTAKSGLDGLMKSLALELGPKGVRVNVVSPGLTLTDATSFMDEGRKAQSAQRTPLRRNGTPEDVAGAILLMVSDLAGFVTGAYLPASGGALML